jgi:membrane-associated protein
MSLLHAFVDLFLHLDTHLQAVIAAYGAWTYGLLTLIVFCETGLVVLPLLPGDSLLFAAGTFAAAGSLSLPVLMLLLTIAAIVGDTVNYAIGAYLGPKVFRENGRLLNREHLEKTRAFYEKHGPKTIILARFLPIIRTFAPFVAGIGKMHYGTFIAYNVIGGIVWACGFLTLGYLFGNIPVVRDHFETVIFAIIGISLLPGVIEFARAKMKKPH